MKSAAYCILALFVCLLAASCQNRRCTCEHDDALIARNDSTINRVVNQSGNSFARYWKRFEEPTLYDSKVEAYRLTVLVSLFDYFKVYRIEHRDDQYTLHVKEYAVRTTARYRPDSLVSSSTRPITQQQWQGIRDAFENNCFWTLPVDIKEDDNYQDGTGWALEGIQARNSCTKAQYHLAHRVSPKGPNPFVNICEQLMAFDSLKVKQF